MKDDSRYKNKKVHINDYIRLGQILQKVRSPLKQEAVDAVLHSEASLRQKIDQIAHIDRTDERYAKPKVRQEETFPHKQKDKAIPAGDEVDEQIQIAKRNQIKIKRLQTHNGFFKFLLREYGRIKQFGVRSKILVVRFPFRLRINPRALEIIHAEYVRESARDILSALESILPNAWRVLDKYEYNCLVACAEFCGQLLKTEFLGLPCRERTLLFRFRELERLFLVLHSDRQIIKSVFLALDKLRKREPEREQMWHKIEGNLRLLFNNSDDYPSIHNLILGLNMIHWRRFFLLSDFIDHGVGNVIASSAFDCLENVRNMIQIFIEEQEAKLVKLVKERSELTREIALLPVNAKGEVDYSTLIVFYNQQVSPEQTGAFNRDAEQVLFFMIRLIDFFIKSFQPLLNGTLMFESSEMGIIFPDDICSSDVDRLIYSLKKLERHAFSFGSFTRQRYLEIRNTNKIATSTEAEAFSIINEILMSVHAIGRKISSVIALDNAAFADLPDQGNPGGRNESESSLIPFAGKMIRSAGILAGKRVREAVLYAACVAHSIGLYLADPSVLSIITREKSLNADIEGVLQLLQRIAPAPVFLEMQKKYALTGRRYS
jgi:hypothetical protein